MDRIKCFAGVEGLVVDSSITRSVPYFATILTQSRGSTGSTLILLDSFGQTLASVHGKATNPLLIGLEECVNRISAMADEAKSLAKIPVEEPFDSLGLCLSGCGSSEQRNKLENSILASEPAIAKSCVVADDTFGSVQTCNLDGIMLISGTGSNSLLFESGRVLNTCGGWGHLFGDEGSAYWIAWRAYKTLLDDNDNYRISKYDTVELRRVIRDHFSLADERFIDCFYQQNDKKRFASLSKELYKATKSSNDDAINDIFKQAGGLLALKVVALTSRNGKPTTLNNTLDIVCVGSVFKGWDLLKPGFVDVLAQYFDNFKLHRLTKSSAFGAAKLALQRFDVDLHIGQTTELFYEFTSTSSESSFNCEIKESYRDGNSNMKEEPMKSGL